MPNNINMPLGAVHIHLPFNSIDDVEFSGAYGDLADKLVQTLREHLQKNGGEPNPEDNESGDDEEKTNDSPPDALRKYK
jgi:hypothetical protein